MKTSAIVLLMLPFITAPALAQDESEFTLIKKEGTVSIYERWITFPGIDPPQSGREVKGEFTIKSNIYDALNLIKDEEKIKLWQSHVSEFKVYPSEDTALWYEYSYHDIPWPVSDQDHFLVYELVKKDTEELHVAFSSLEEPSLAPLRKGVTRMELEGSWRITRISDSEIKVIYRIISEPIGIPRLFTDPIVRRNLMSTIESFVEILEKDG